ncbi:MAG: sigma-70 family RNA polymerase sigma factor [Gemmataceae bacterium]|nr:sigma-70 family RNA polymerase sigma factor [Gemmataceae bacterium]
MVLSLCERLLDSPADAEDAFQAVFLTLALKGNSVGDRDAVGGWLYRVTYRICLRARAAATTRARRQRPLDAAALDRATYEPVDELAWSELRPLLDAEVERLPEKYRAAFVLCCLEGLTCEEAAAQLGCPKGTILSRLARARERLRARLERLAPTAAGHPVASLLQRRALPSPVAAGLLSQTMTATGLAAQGKLSLAQLTPAVAALLRNLPGPFAALRLKLLAALIALLAVAGTAAGVYVYANQPGKAGTSTNTPAPLSGGCGGCGGSP